MLSQQPDSKTDQMSTGEREQRLLFFDERTTMGQGGPSCLACCNTGHSTAHICTCRDQVVLLGVLPVTDGLEMKQTGTPSGRL